MAVYRDACIYNTNETGRSRIERNISFRGKRLIHRHASFPFSKRSWNMATNCLHLFTTFVVETASRFYNNVKILLLSSYYYRIYLFPLPLQQWIIVIIIIIRARTREERRQIPSARLEIRSDQTTFALLFISCPVHRAGQQYDLLANRIKRGRISIRTTRNKEHLFSFLFLLPLICPKYYRGDK